MTKKIIFHIDLDAFFAAVEQLDHPDWRGKPVIVGAQPGHRGVVSTCSYEARQFGVRSAMPISKAWELCPQGIYVQPHFTRYQELSRKVMKELANFSPDVRQMSIDEAYLDMTGTEKLFGPPRQAAAALKSRVLQATHLKVSVGIAPNHYLAKLASDYGKPDGLFEIVPEGVDAFMENLPLKKLHGAGSKTQERLAGLGITTINQLRGFDLETLESLMGQGGGHFLYRACRGQADYDPHREAQSHSISGETTLEEDSADGEALKQILLALSHEVMFRALEEGWESRTVSIKLRLSDFSTSTAQTTLRAPVQSSSELFHVALSLFTSRWKAERAVRLIGVGLSNLEKPGSTHQSELFEQENEKQGRVEKAIVALRKRKGDPPSITKASLLKKKGRRGE